MSMLGTFSDLKTSENVPNRALKSANTLRRDLMLRVSRQLLLNQASHFANNFK